ncbi:hypothetical protein P8452_44371 [Trifolium repens]|nr:hypothetical protein P8452_44371 [Trifolium repens]
MMASFLFDLFRSQNNLRSETISLRFHVSHIPFRNFTASFFLQLTRFVSISDSKSSKRLCENKKEILASLYSGNVFIWNYQSQTREKSFKVTDQLVRSAKFIARKEWVVAGADDKFIRIFDWNTENELQAFMAHRSYITCVAVHPTLPHVISSSDDSLIKLWDWEKGWICSRTFKGHSDRVMQVTFSPTNTNTFASASLDGSIKIWNLDSPNPNFTLDAHKKGVNCIDYYTGGGKPYLITGSDDQTARVWDYQTKSCVQTLDGHPHNVSAVCFHPELPVIITGCEDGTVRIWHSTTYSLEKTLSYDMKSVWAIGYLKGSRRVVIGNNEEIISVKLVREKPVASMDNSGKIIWAKHNNIETVNIRSVGADAEIADGKFLQLDVKELGTCDFYPQSLRHNPNGRFVVVSGDGKYSICTALAWRNRLLDSALEVVWSSDGEYAVRESISKIKVFSKRFREEGSIHPTFSAERIFGGTVLAICSNFSINFFDWFECMWIWRINLNVKNLYWADSGDLVAISSDKSFYILKYNSDVVSSFLDSGKSVDDKGVEGAFKVLHHEESERFRTGVWVGDCFIYTNESWNLNYWLGGKVTTMFQLDRPMYFLGYLASQNTVYLIDKEFNIVGFTSLIRLIEYTTLMVRGHMKRANEILPLIPNEHRHSLAQFLESQGRINDAFVVAIDPVYRNLLQLKRENVSRLNTDRPYIYIWDNLDITIVQEPAVQRFDTCMIIALARQVEYQLRIIYALADPPIQLKDKPLINDRQWRIMLLEKFPEIQGRWDEFKLLDQTINKFKVHGCLLANSMIHWVKETWCISRHDRTLTIDSVKSLIERRIPLVGVIDIYLNAYKPSAQDCYLLPSEDSGDIRIDSHAVLIVGYYEANEENEYGLKPGVYFLYQDW